jgi:hypothetical protein
MDAVPTAALYLGVDKIASFEDKRRSGVQAQPLDLSEGRRIRSTTVLCVRRGGRMVMAAS